MPLQSFALHDVHPLYGGRSLWATDDHSAIICVVARSNGSYPGFWEKRYRVQISQQEWTDVESLVEWHHFFEMVVEQRMGIPDEARPIIEMVSKTGAAAKLQMWASTKHPGFHAIYRRLWELSRLEGELVSEQPFEWNWRPEGFPPPPDDQP